MYSPRRVVELINEMPWLADEVIRVLWVRIVDGGRDEFAAAIEASRGNASIIALVIRERLFVDGNMLLADFVKLVTANRPAFERLTAERHKTLSILVLAREELRLPQGGSPVILPEWFPVSGGKEVHFRISDLAVRAEVDLLNCEEARIEDTAAALCELESVIVRRLQQVQSQASDAQEALWLLLFETKELKAPRADFLAMFRQHCESVVNPRAYRPSVANGKSMGSRLLRLVLKSSPDQLATVSDACAAALRFSETAILQPSLFAVMLRPVRRPSQAAMSCHAMLLAFYSGYQFVTGAAHAGEYPEYPLALIYSTSMDIRRSLRASIAYINQLPS
jgi:hypothetical protein